MFLNPVVVDLVLLARLIVEDLEVLLVGHRQLGHICDPVYDGCVCRVGKNLKIPANEGEQVHKEREPDRVRGGKRKKREPA